MIYAARPLKTFIFCIIIFDIYKLFTSYLVHIFHLLLYLVILYIIHYIVNDFIVNNNDKCIITVNTVYFRDLDYEQ